MKGEFKKVIHFHKIQVESKGSPHFECNCDLESRRLQLSMKTKSKLNATIKKRAGGADNAAATVKVSAMNYYKANETQQ